MRQPRGMTLIEAVVSLAILSVIMIMASQLTMSMNMVSAEETAETQIQTDLRRAMAELIFLVEESRPVAMWREDQLASKLPHLPKAPDGTYNYNQNEDLKDRGMVYTFTIPLKDINGRLLRKGTTVVNKYDHGEAVYGSGDMGSGSEYNDGTAGSDKNTYSVFFLPNGEVLDEAVEGIDMDANGVTNERFVYGGLFISDDSTQQIRQITGRIALKRFTGLAGIYTTAQEMERSADGRGKVFYLEREDWIEDTGADPNGVYDNYNNDSMPSDPNGNGRWDVKMIIRFYFPMITEDSRRGKVARLRAIETRINYFRNTYKKDKDK